jgi:hypothetical protein
LEPSINGSHSLGAARYQQYATPILDLAPICVRRFNVSNDSGAGVDTSAPVTPWTQLHMGLFVQVLHMGDFGLYALECAMTPCL